MTPSITPSTEARAGVLYAGAAYVLWGIVPIYWRWLEHVPPLELTLHRVFWCAILVGVLVAGRDRFAAVRAAVARGATLRALAVSSLLIAFNWTLYIWCVATDQLVEASLGYYITPLVSIALGIVLLGERMSRLRQGAIGLAALAVVLQAGALGHFPWIALSLALSFGLYGYVRKTVPVGALDGLFVETAVLFPVVTAVLGVWMVTGEGAFGTHALSTDLLLILSGAVTALPLALFAAGARRVRMSTLGFLQYLAPSITLVLAVGWFGEPFTWLHGVTFALIWAALGLISLESLRRQPA